MKYCLLVLLFCIPCHAEKLPSNFEEANQLALINASSLKSKAIWKFMMNNNNLRVLEWCIDEHDAWSAINFDLVFELNYQGKITRTFKNIDSPIANCFILNLLQDSYPETHQSNYYISAPFIINGVLPNIPKPGFEFEDSSSLSEAQQKWLHNNL